MADKICGIVTETMMYRVGEPLPVPAGYTIEPFLVVGIVMVEQGVEAGPADQKESDPVVEPEPVADPVVDYLIFAVPDWNELWDAEGRPKPPRPKKCPEEKKAEDPNWEINWPKAVQYNRSAREHEENERRLVISVSADVVVRTERVVDKNEFQQLVRDFTKREAEETPTEGGEPAAQQVGEKTQVVQPDAGGSPNA